MKWMRVVSPLAAALLLGAWLAACGGPPVEESAVEEGAVAEGTAAAVEPPLPADLETLEPRIRERITAAVAAVERAEQERTPAASNAWRELGMLYHAHDLFDLARVCYERSAAFGGDARSWYYLALVEHRLGRPAAATAALRRTLELAPEYAPARWRLGVWLAEGGELAAGRQEVARALAEAPGDRAATLALARLELQAGEAGRAAELLEARLAADPDDGYASLLLGTAYTRLGRSEEARQQLARGTGAESELGDPWSDEVAARASGFDAELRAALERLGPDPAAAAARLVALRAERPEDVTVLINLGIAWRRAGRLAASAAVLEEAVARHPERGLAHFQLAATYLAQAATTGADASTLLARALEHADRAVELQPNAPRGEALRGEILAVAGRYDAAAAAYARATSRDPLDPAWLRRLGDLYCRLGRWQEAIPVLEGFLRRTGDDVDALFLLGAAQANAGRLAEAEATLERGVRLAPEDPRLRQARDQLARARRTSGAGS